MTILSDNRLGRLVDGRVVMPLAFERVYHWERDFPLSRQERTPNGVTTFRLEFRLSEVERADFKADIGSTLNENLAIEMLVGRRDVEFRIVKSGRGATTLNRRARRIAQFIRDRVSFTYIPAVRTASTAMDIVRDMVDRELRHLELDTRYQEAIAELGRLQQPVLDSISTRISGTLRDFLPQIASVKVIASDDTRHRAIRRSIDVIVDDGTPTALERKGDGVQSLTAIGLMRGASGTKGNLVLAIEEPESHLHPAAIHRLREVIEDISAEHQVIITTHNPLFVNRQEIARNVIVRRSKAESARRISDIRAELGVRASDNLIHAAWVLVVEGESDQVALKAILAHESTALRAALREGLLVVDHLGGSGKLPYKLSELRNALCGVHVFLDNDQAGQLAVKKALDAGLIRPPDYHLCTVPGRKYSELEDLLDPSLYAKLLDDEFGVSPRAREWASKEQWGMRLEAASRAAGKLLEEKTVAAIKARIAALVATQPSLALTEHTRVSIEPLRGALEAKLMRIKQARSK
jgi:putative ATP-dependent endonuclease of the OLD family